MSEVILTEKKIVKIPLKILIAGDASVGKTSLLKRYVEGEFNKLEPLTVGIDFFEKEIKGNNSYQLQLWDIAGQERFRFMVDQYLLGTKGAILLFDITNMKSFVNIQKWTQLLRSKYKELPILLVGTKCDLEEFSLVQDLYTEKLVDKLNLSGYVKTSAKINLNVGRAFEVIIRTIMKTLEI